MKAFSIKSMVRPVMIGALLALPFSSVQAGEKVVQTAIPATNAAIWQSIDGAVADLRHTVESGKLSDVHHHAFAIRDLVAALPAHSGSLPADKIAKVQASSKFVGILAERLDAAGDANDKAATVANFQKLQELLKSIRENYDAAGTK